MSIRQLNSELKVQPFDLNAAMQGSLVGYKTSDGTIKSGTLRKVNGEATTSNGGAVYSMKDEGAELFFDKDGNCITNGHTDIHLGNVSASLPSYSGNQVTTRAGGETLYGINAIRPIDEFATSIIQTILEKLVNPQEMSDANILKWCGVAYKWAVGMFSVASTFRTASDDSVNANADSLKGAVEKITTALNTSNANAKTLQSVIESLRTSVENISSTISNQETKLPDTFKVRLSDTVKVDNPTDDKFDVNGSGGGLSYDELLDIADDITDVPAFNGKALGRATIANLAKKVIALDTSLEWLRKVTESTFFTTYANAIHEAIKTQINADIDTAVDKKLAQFATDYNLKKQ